MNYKKEISKFSENIKKKFKNNYEKVFFGKLQSLTIENKLYLYSKLKTNYTINNFIMNSNFENRKLICKMRISDHFLEIERGRYKKINNKRIPRDERICKNCNLQKVEDEYHFFFECSKNSQFRIELE